MREPVTVADLLLGGMRHVLQDYPLEVLQARIPGGRLRLSAAGDALLQEAALWPSEAAMSIFEDLMNPYWKKDEK